MSVQSLLGLLEKDVFVSVKGIDGLHKVRLQVVEKYGVWVENEELVKMLLSALGWQAGNQKGGISALRRNPAHCHWM